MFHRNWISATLKLWLLAVFIYGDGLVVLGQSKYQNLSSTSKKAIELYEEADYFYVRKDYYNVIELLQKAVKKDDHFIEAYFRLGNSSYILGDTLQARINWVKAIDLADRSPGHAYLYFYIGRLYFEQEEYIKSEKSYATYLKLVNAESRQRRDVEFRHKSAEFAIKSIAEQLDFNPRPLGGELNQFVLQYFPDL